METEVPVGCRLLRTLHVHHRIVPDGAVHSATVHSGKTYVPQQESFSSSIEIHLGFVRHTQTHLVMSQEHRIDDYWNASLF